MKRYFLMALGCFGVALGFVGAILPLLPAFPFLLLAAICFGKSDPRLAQWFQSTKLYQENLADFLAGQGMTKEAKKRVMTTITLVMSIGFFCLRGHGVGQVILGIVWLGHMVYFLRFVKQRKEATL